MLNKGIELSLSKGKWKLVFDRSIKTNRGFLTAVEIYPRGAESANPAIFEDGKTVDINYARRVWDHAPQDTLKYTAEY